MPKGKHSELRVGIEERAEIWEQRKRWKLVETRSGHATEEKESSRDHLDKDRHIAGQRYQPGT